jgi:hypothetical protein
LITNSPVLAYFDNQKPTTLNVDASCVGIEAVVMETDQPVAYGSRILTACEQRFANFGVFTGKRVTVKTDHKIFKKSLNKAPRRLQRMLLKLTKNDLDVQYVLGKQHVISVWSSY